MTRINCIPVTELNSKMLLAEYRELPRVSGLVWKWHDRTYTEKLNAAVVPNPPKSYRLGKGHVIFFYDKGEFLRKRFEEELVPEMQRRGFVTNFTTYRQHPRSMNADWTPTEEEMNINRQRIQERLRRSAKTPSNQQAITEEDQDV